MQLKKNIRASLAAATGSLLGALPATSAQAAEGEDMTVDLSQLYYEEQNRVTVHKSQGLLSRALGDETLARFNFIFDSISGASPNGRLVSAQDEVTSLPVTLPSGFTFNVTEGEFSDKPWITRFEDTRVAVGGELEHELTRTTKVTGGVNYSVENDYTSLGVSGSVDLALNNKRTVVTLGGGVNQDRIEPEAGIPEGLGYLRCNTNPDAWPIWLQCTQPRQFEDARDKSVTSGLLGVTQVWNAKTRLQLNYNVFNYSGYLSDPYKQLSVIYDPDEQPAATAGLFNERIEVAIVHEKRPDTRKANALLFRIIAVEAKNSLNLSARYFRDDWGITARTLDGRLRSDLSEKFYFQLHGRMSSQNAADFYYTSLPNTLDVLEYASADHRLGKQTTTTLGIKFGRKWKQSGVALRVERMNQVYYSSDLPNMSVLIAQLLINLKF